MSTSPATPRSEPRRPRPRPATDVLLVGPWQARGFSAAIVDVEALKAAAAVPTINDACTLFTSLVIAPELVFVAQQFPGDFRQEHVSRLQKLAPLARIVIVAGSWCEGELRTGRPPTGVLRLYWYELAPWWQANERRLAAGLAPTWSAPLDHPQSGRYAVAGKSAVLPLTAIHADDFAVYESFVDAGLPALWTRGEAVTEAEAGIFDGGQLGDRELERLTSFCDQVSGRVIALLDFPRIEAAASAQSAGAAAVFSKPYIVDEVLAALVESRVASDRGAVPSPHF